jgi:threonine/homoserine/homoserine lactone efflux protein
MIDGLTLLAFLPAALALNLTPGADMMFCLGQGLRAGPGPAVAASAGISLGVMAHVALAGLGLGAAVAALPWLFDAIRWAGIAYLLWLAVQALRHPPGAAAPPTVRPARAFRDGFIVNLANPKVVLFVLAFLPQFIDPDGGSVLVRFLVLGLVIAAGGFAVNALVGVFAGGLGRRLAGSAAVARGMGYAGAAIFAALALRLALYERS